MFRISQSDALVIARKRQIRKLTQDFAKVYAVENNLDEYDEQTVQNDAQVAAVYLFAYPHWPESNSTAKCKMKQNKTLNDFIHYLAERTKLPYSKVFQALRDNIEI